MEQFVSNFVPRPKLVALGGKYAEILAIYDEVTGNLVLAEPSSGTVLPVPLTTVILHFYFCLPCTLEPQVVQSVRENLTSRLTGKKETQETLRMLPDFAQENKLLFFAPRFALSF